MNSIHDCGGMEGFGPIAQEHDEPVFHSAWEAQMFGLNWAIACLGHWNIDADRHAIERMGNARYLETSYYEHWLISNETLLVEKGVLTKEELDAKRAEIARQMNRGVA